MILTPELIQRADAAGRTVTDDAETLSYSDLAARVAETVEKLDAQPWAAPGYTVALPLTNDIAGICALLALFERSVSVVLLPADDDGATPAFCSARLDTSTMTGSDVNLEARTTDKALVYLRTSGSTGEPKWVVITHDALILNADGVRDRMSLSTEDCVLIPVPVYHMYGLGAALLPSLQGGSSMRVSAKGDPLAIFGAERSANPTMAYMIPSQCRAIQPLRHTARLYRRIVVATGRLSSDLAEKFEEMNGPVAGLYGSSEMGAIAAADPASEADRRRRDIGPPLNNVELFIEDGESEDGGPVTGPIFVKHGTGYLGYADATGEIQTPAPERHPTNDLGYISPEGDLSVIGRADNRIKRDGLWVVLGDIEASLADAPGVGEVTVVTAGTTRRGMGVVVYYVAARGADIGEEDLMRHCRDTLPGHAVPDRIVQIDAFQRLASGKTDLRSYKDKATELLAG